MRFERSLTFAKVIEEHLELKRKNSTLEDSLHIDRYSNSNSLDNHPLFKTEEEARLEETVSGSSLLPNHELSLAFPNGSAEAPDEKSFWGRTRDFDWDN
tara:strand:+ start:173 stop:469 length:297 start_codon:yes stop_codon:yes gene_type:complete